MDDQGRFFSRKVDPKRVRWRETDKTEKDAHSIRKNGMRMNAWVIMHRRNALASLVNTHIS